MAVILLYALPVVYSRVSGYEKEYQHYASQLKEVLLEDEVRDIEGNLFVSAKRKFFIAFLIANLGYAVLGSLAFLLHQAIKVGL